MFLELMKHFFIKKCPTLQPKDMFIMVLDACNCNKFSRHVILRLFHSNEEFMYTNNFDSLRKHILQFKEYILNFIFNPHVRLVEYDGIDFYGNRKYLRKYVKNVDETEQNIVYDKIATNYFVDHIKEAGICLEDGESLNLYVHIYMSI